MKTTAAQTAKAIKQELKQLFPTVKFSVKSSTYSGGSSVDVDWEDGPTITQVLFVLDKYEYGKFNSMEDMYESNNRREDIPQVKYVMEHRTMSQKTREELIAYVAQNYAGAQGCGYHDYIKEQREYFNTLVHREFYKKSFSEVKPS